MNKSPVESRGGSGSQGSLCVPSKALQPSVLVVGAVVHTPVRLWTVENWTFIPSAIHVVKPNLSSAFGRWIKQTT